MLEKDADTFLLKFSDPHNRPFGPNHVTGPGVDAAFPETMRNGFYIYIYKHITTHYL